MPVPVVPSPGPPRIPVGQLPQPKPPAKQQQGGQGKGSTQPSDGGQSDWTNLFTRLAEFGIGVILITIGISALVGHTKTFQTINVEGGKALGKAPGVVGGIVRG